MRNVRFWVVLCSLLLTVTFLAWAQSRKAGLWEITSTMSLQQSPYPPGMDIPANSPLSPAPQTTQVCLTQAMIDKYGAPIPDSRSDCQVSHVQRGEHGMTGELVCSGRMSGKGTIESSWADPEHAKGSVHFVGTVQGRANPRPIEWTRQSTSVFKGSDCGNVKPVPMPGEGEPRDGPIL